MKPVSNKLVYISDTRENDYTYGSSTMGVDYSVRTNENGFFSITINGGKISTTISIGNLYNVPKNIVVTNKEELLSHNRYEEDTCWHTECLYYKTFRTTECEHLQNLVIYLDEYPELEIEPNVIRRNQSIKITCNAGLYYVHSCCLEDLIYYKNWQQDSMTSARKWFYEYWFGKNGMPFDKTMDITLNIPDSVPAGYYRFRLFGSAYYGGSREPDCIIQLVDDPADN